ncbi:DNA-binding MarR family transcriptional regulator [Brevibacterium sanguinis]|uniref:DNA-binding MarR family transcriptional regulator n=2 Tax=Brevibacterium TaxID=1696 RepID=A0A366IND6_9MICO|nr:MarR family transcriptional regulator [Brevibacterium celere]RBP67990.1 DNA-binding MarR family transcriptional regulator [Brevibacterium sanguinis]RBP74593.1 DNA-binding MarR family transcriptional regulator [Brevibacterium celere]
MRTDARRIRRSTGVEARSAEGSPQPVRFGRDAEALAQQSWRLYIETSQRLSQVLEAGLREESGLVLGDYNVLLLLWEAPRRTLTMSALARRLVFSPSRLNYRIRLLEEAGLVRKTGCPDDRRAHNVTLTAQGEETFVEAARRQRRHVDELFLDHVRAEELTVLHTVFRRIAEALPD